LRATAVRETHDAGMATPSNTSVTSSPRGRNEPPQFRANPAKTRIAKAPEIILQH